MCAVLLLLWWRATVKIIDDDVMTGWVVALGAWLMIPFTLVEKCKLMSYFCVCAWVYSLIYQVLDFISNENVNFQPDNVMDGADVCNGRVMSYKSLMADRVKFARLQKVRFFRKIDIVYLYVVLTNKFCARSFHQNCSNAKPMERNNYAVD